MSVEQLQPENYIRPLNYEGYVAIPYELGSDNMAPLFTDFSDLLATIDDLPPDTRQDWYQALHNYVPGREDDSQGFLVRRRIGEANSFEARATKSSDNKEVLHWTPRTWGTAEERFRSRGLPSPMRQVLERCQEVHEAAVRALRPVVRELGLEDMLLAPEGHEEDNVHVVRLIHYLGHRVTKQTLAPVEFDPLAELHFDRSKLTLALWESTPGLVGTPAQNLRGDPALTLEALEAHADQALCSPIAHRPREAKLFAGAGYNHLPLDVRQASGEIPLLLHGVLDAQPGTPRDAAVVFINQRISAPGISCPTQVETDYRTMCQALTDYVPL